GTVFLRKELTVAKAPVAPAKKGRADIFITDSSYVLKPTNLVFNREVKLMLTPPPNSTGQSKYIGKWDPEESVWDSLASTINAVNLIETDIGDGGEYIAIAKSKSIAIENLSLLPNPFSPSQETQGRPGLKIEFDLSSSAAPNPLFSVKIYNLEGNLVRLLHDQTPFPRGRSVIFWDGRTDNGTLARNGRYLVRLTLEDPANHKDLLRSVVLIK
ncbi:MAG: FlgD immunoglobulin-like domain containing protein, partial [bacterium]